MDIPRVRRVRVNNVSKIFKIGYKNNDSALFRLISLVSGKQPERPLQVLENISFEVCAGENLGLIGKNGSGKSTLLRLIAGIYQCDGGEIKLEGKLTYISGLGFGLKQGLTMRENIYLVGLIMGLSQKEIKKRFADIVSFSGLDEFLDTKIYQFSSGMLSRLRFSITIHCLEQKNPDILLLDEVFGSGGDLAFEEKAIAKMEEFTRSGAAVILVSHNLNIIKKYCSRAILLHQGQIFKETTAEETIKYYRELVGRLPGR